MNENRFVLQFAVQAIDDINEIIFWYEKKVNGLGEEFEIDLHESFIKIQSNPEAFSRYKKRSNVRKKLLSVFPYKIFYAIEGFEINILAIIHNSRSNRFINRRLK